MKLKHFEVQVFKWLFFLKFTKYEVLCHKQAMVFLVELSKECASNMTELIKVKCRITAIPAEAEPLYLEQFAYVPGL